MQDDNNIIENIDWVNYKTSRWCVLHSVSDRDVEDYRAQAMLLLCEANQTYKQPSDATFKTYAWKVIKNGLQDYHSKERGHANMIDEIKTRFA